MSGFFKKLVPPAVNPTRPPGITPGERRLTWDQLLGKPTTLAGAGITGAGGASLTAPIIFHCSGQAPITGARDEVIAGVYPVYAITRAGAVRGFLGVNSSDQLCLLAADGTTLLAEFSSSGTAIDRTVAAGVNTFVALKRSGVIMGYVGLDASDELALIAADGTTVLGWVTALGELNALLRHKAPHLLATTDTKSPIYQDGNGVQVVGVQQPSISNAGTASASTASGTNATTDPVSKAEFNALVAQFNQLVTDTNAAIGVLNTAAGQLNALLGAVRTHGLIHV